VWACYILILYSSRRKQNICFEKHSRAQRIHLQVGRAVLHNILLMSSFSCGHSKVIISSLAH
jgi:hypothetical protein